MTWWGVLLLQDHRRLPDCRLFWVELVGGTGRVVQVQVCRAGQGRVSPKLLSTAAFPLWEEAQTVTVRCNPLTHAQGLSQVT